MFRTLAGLTVMTALAMGGPVEAAGPGGKKYHGPGMSGHHDSHKGHKPGYYKQYSLRHGHKFSHGYYYEGRWHGHWRSIYYSNRYRTTLYFDEGFGTWYYWAARRNAFFPFSYIEIEPPTVDLGPNVYGPEEEDDE